MQILKKKTAPKVEKSNTRRASIKEFTVYETISKIGNIKYGRSIQFCSKSGPHVLSTRFFHGGLILLGSPLIFKARILAAVCATFRDSYGGNLISKENHFKSKVCRSFYFLFLRPSNFHEFRPQECQIWDVRRKSVLIICSIYFIKK